MVAVAARKRGARPKHPSKRRSESVRIPLTEEEKRLIERAAATAELGIAEFVRAQVMPAARRLAGNDG